MRVDCSFHGQTTQLRRLFGVAVDEIDFLGAVDHIIPPYLDIAHDNGQHLQKSQLVCKHMKAKMIRYLVVLGIEEYHINFVVVNPTT